MASATRPRRLRHGPRRRAGGVKRRRETGRRDPHEAAALTPIQVRTIHGIVNLFETGSILGDYGQVTLIPGDSGHLTFGRSQATLGSGGLSLLLCRYCANAGARFGSRLAPYLDGIAARDVSLDRNLALHNILRATADDPVMRGTQDGFFDAGFFQPALREARDSGITDPLGCAIVYDSFVHGSWEPIRDRVEGQPRTRGQRPWLIDYVAVRREWLATHPRADLRATVYRMDAIGRLIDLGAWALELPLVVRGVEISMATLEGAPPGCFDDPGTRDAGSCLRDVRSLVPRPRCSAGAGRALAARPRYTCRWCVWSRVREDRRRVSGPRRPSGDRCRGEGARGEAGSGGPAGCQDHRSPPPLEVLTRRDPGAVHQRAGPEWSRDVNGSRRQRVRLATARNSPEAPGS